MKKIITLILIAFSTCAYSQFSIGMHIGSSNKAIIGGFHSQFEFNNGFTAGINMTSHLGAENPAYFQTRLGQTIGNADGFTIQPYIGYSYSVQSADQKNFKGNFTGGVQMRYQLNDIALVYSDINIPSKKMMLFSIGFAGKLPGRN